MARGLGECATPLVSRHDLVMFDMDGVVKVGGRPVAGAAEHIAGVRTHGTQVAFVTNNASRTPEQVAQQLTSFGVAATSLDVVTSAQAAARLVVDQHGPGAPVWVLGGEGLRAAVHEAGLVATDEESRAVALLSGYGPDVLWRDILHAAVLVRGGLPYVASNTDSTIPTDVGVAPGHGALVRLISEFAGVQPQVAGKPAPPLLRETIARAGAGAPLMVGDRMDTDVLGAHAVGVPSLLVMTGVTTVRDLLAAPPRVRPTFVAADLRGLHESHPLPADEAPGDEVRLNGWTVHVEHGELLVGGDGAEGDWLRAMCTAAWAWLDTTGEPVGINGLVVPPGFVSTVGR